MSLQPNWEYKIIHLDEDDLDILETKLNSLGLDAWELVSFDGEIGILKRKQLYFVDSRTLISDTRPRPERN